jgi:DNA polymerase-3 subunit gamma/tau
MNYHLKYRPNSFEELIGNENLVDTLKGILRNPDERPHSFLFHGPTGCGKTTLGRIVAKELGAIGGDLREVDSADFRGIDTVRDIRKQSQYRPLEGPCRVWILDECHKMSNDAQNALLKALEDTPPHVYFILCTTDPQKLIATIRGRCAQFQVQPLGDRDMLSLLRRVVKGEGERLTKQVYDQIIQDAQGHPRNALQVLAQVLVVDDEKRVDVAKQTAELQSQTIELCRALIASGPSWKNISTLLVGLKEQDPEGIRRAVLGYCQAVLLKSGQNDMAARVMEEFIDPFYDSGFPGLTLACYSVVYGG